MRGFIADASHELRMPLTINKETGMLAEVRRRGRTVPFGNGPRFVAFRRNDRKYLDVAGRSALTGFASRTEGKDLIVETNYIGALRQARWRGSPGGAVRLDYEYTFDGAVDLLGVQFDAAEAQMRGIRWLGWGPYRVWQNRLHGTRLDVWENRYNDTTPGESWVYPEFKGYFRAWRWAVFDTHGGKVTVVNEADDSYLGVYKPKDGREGLLDFPETGIAFLDMIPAMRDKGLSPSQLGPQFKQRQVSGGRRGTVSFRFGL